MLFKINKIADEKRVVQWGRHWANFWEKNGYCYKLPVTTVAREYSAQKLKIKFNKNKLKIFNDLPITVRFTSYGCSGFYWPETNEVFVNVNYKGDIVELITHEIAHLLIEGYIAKNNIGQDKKEKIVEKIVSRICGAN